MRFKTDVKNLRTFSKLTAALSSVEKITWARLDELTVRFTVIPDSGSQVWASLAVDLIFDNYTIQSAEPGNTINLELPLQPLQRALRSAQNSVSASLRLTKRQGVPVLCMTITTATTATTTTAGKKGKIGGGGDGWDAGQEEDVFEDEAGADGISVTTAGGGRETRLRRECEKVVTQDIPVRVLHPESFNFMQPRVREADVHIQLPPLTQLKAISDRFTRLASVGPNSTSSNRITSTATNNSFAHSQDVIANNTTPTARLELSANMHGSLRIRVATDAGILLSTWTGLTNPQLDPAHLDGGDVAAHPSVRFREAGPDRWATVRVDGRDWSKVLSVGRLEGRVIACLSDEHALILYVYVPHYDNAGEEDSVITYYVQSYSA